jgi:ribose 5-phosphate isomerase RpiB
MRVAIAANKLPGIRAAYAADHYTGHQMVEHDLVKSWDDLLACIGSKADQVRTAN